MKLLLTVFVFVFLFFFGIYKINGFKVSPTLTVRFVSSAFAGLSASIFLGLPLLGIISLF